MKRCVIVNFYSILAEYSNRLYIYSNKSFINRSRKAVADTESSELSTSEKNKAIEDGQNNNIEPAAYLSG